SLTVMEGPRFVFDSEGEPIEVQWWMESYLRREYNGEIFSREERERQREMIRQASLVSMMTESMSMNGGGKRNPFGQFCEDGMQMISKEANVVHLLVDLYYLVRNIEGTLCNRLGQPLPSPRIDRLESLLSYLKELNKEQLNVCRATRSRSRSFGQFGKTERLSRSTSQSPIRSARFSVRSPLSLSASQSQLVVEDENPLDEPIANQTQELIKKLKNIQKHIEDSLSSLRTFLASSFSDCLSQDTSCQSAVNYFLTSQNTESTEDFQEHYTILYPFFSERDEARTTFEALVRQIKFKGILHYAMTILELDP
ncbi:MAG: hypothetical protein KDK63_02460, partial [Chlamydiia bacterium]|nr:hypothetical protein [Chlamydiia bacterium]